MAEANDWCAALCAASSVTLRHYWLRSWWGQRNGGWLAG